MNKPLAKNQLAWLRAAPFSHWLSSSQYFLASSSSLSQLIRSRFHLVRPILIGYLQLLSHSAYSWPWWWKWYAPLKRRYTSTTIHGAVFQKAVTFLILPLYLPTSLFVPVFMTNNLHAFLTTPIRVTHSSQVNVIDLVSLVILLKIMIYEAFPSIMFISLSYFLCLRPQYYSYHVVLNRSAFSSLIIGDKVSLAWRNRYHSFLCILILSILLREKKMKYSELKRIKKSRI
jgi:hypothetical protein